MYYVIIFLFVYNLYHFFISIIIFQLPQQMSQVSLGDMNFSSATGKPTNTAALPGQTLSTNLWQ